ncbi:MAG: hypothetical protein LC650_03390 [Actinobacteria bacterium]|nr:hypothetical protein [Actinomycetota bacterium]
MAKLNMKWLTEQEVDQVFYQGNWNTGFGGFDYQAFAEAIQAEVGRKKEEAARNQCTCRYEGSPCPACRRKSKY